MQEQLKLIGLFAACLVYGASGFLAADTKVELLLGQTTPEATAMIGRFARRWFSSACLQALAMWALASRWIKISLLYGALGLAYWLALLFLGKSPAACCT